MSRSGVDVGLNGVCAIGEEARQTLARLTQVGLDAERSQHVSETGLDALDAAQVEDQGARLVGQRELDVLAHAVSTADHQDDGGRVLGEFHGTRVRDVGLDRVAVLAHVLAPHRVLEEREERGGVDLVRVRIVVDDEGVVRFAQRCAVAHTELVVTIFPITMTQHDRSL